MTIQEIQDKILKLKDLNSKLISNYYLNNFNNLNINEAYASGKSIFFIVKDHGVNRIYYYTADYKDLCGLLKNLSSSHDEYVLEFMTRDKLENFDLLIDAGFKNLTCLNRISNPDCSSIFNNNNLNKFMNIKAGEVAQEFEAHEINNKLWEIFDTRISHLVDDKELAEIIKAREVLISRGDDNKIISILQTKTQPRKFYINQVYNSGNKSIIHAMLLSKLKLYCGNGGKYLYAWVEESNIASIKFHAKYGMKPDGFLNLIYNLKN